ncbi:hypothetical protein MMC07_001656 [Pseudocyphellaria aurata]|nr:hypothetical protein [Pseudocyphellaria aurata]
MSTPPPDYEGNRIRQLKLEKQARKDLIDDGCPPCYPADLELSSDDVPAQYEKVVSYWSPQPGVRILVLNAQLSDWRNFRDYQQRIRRYHLPRKTFQKYQQQVYDRRRRACEAISLRIEKKNPKDGIQTNKSLNFP